MRIPFAARVNENVHFTNRQGNCQVSRQPENTVFATFTEQKALIYGLECICMSEIDISDVEVTESEWLDCKETDHLLLHLVYIVLPSERKLRLFNCACIRRIWQHLHDDALRACVETCEHFIDGNATSEELEAARARAHELFHGLGDIIEDHGPMAVEDACEANGRFSVFSVANSSADVAAEAADNDGGLGWSLDRDKERAAQCDLIREIIGNPFHPATMHPRWISEKVREIAQGIYDENAFDRLVPLGDALEDAGCDDDHILTHCRQPNGHVRGCWVVDLVLGKV
jgi:hypothetical protein